MIGSDETDVAEDEIFATLREMWRREDPVPVGFVDRMVAAVAVEDVNREFELLALLETAEVRSVRAGGDQQTLQFGDDSACVLLRVVATGAGTSRVDGWSEPPVLAARLAQAGEVWSADPADDGRFGFEHVARGRSQVRMVVKNAQGLREIATAWFEV